MEKTWKERLRERLEAINEADLARRLGVSAPTINRYKSGARTPDPGMLARICREMGWSCDELLGLEADEPTHGQVVAALAHLRHALGLLEHQVTEGEVDAAYRQLIERVQQTGSASTVVNEPDGEYTADRGRDR